MSLAAVWLLSGLLHQAFVTDLSQPPCTCSNGACLPLPRAGAFAPGRSISWDFARTAHAQEPAAPVAAESKAEATEDAGKEGEALFDGESLKGWKESDFAGQGVVEVADGRIVLGVGQDLTGITWDGAELPKTNYELELEAMRVDGADFFCGLTFPVNDEHCSFIVGGWGGTIVGLSSIDKYDASGNDTTKYKSFKRGEWYLVRLRVTPTHISAWIDDEQMVDFAIGTHKLSTRVEVRASQPLGIACWQTSAAIRNIRLRRLEAEAGDTNDAAPSAPRE